MSETNRRQTLEEQAWITREIGDVLMNEFGTGWDAIHFVAKMTWEVADFKTRVIERGIERTEFAPKRVVKLSQELREEMYQAGLGTWFTLKLDVAADGHVTTRFNYDDEPTIEDIDPSVYVTEQKAFPRAEDSQPDWYKERLVEGERLLAQRAAEG